MNETLVAAGGLPPTPESLPLVRLSVLPKLQEKQLLGMTDKDPDKQSRTGRKCQIIPHTPDSKRHETPTVLRIVYKNQSSPDYKMSHYIIYNLVTNCLKCCFCGCFVILRLTAKPAFQMKVDS